MRFVLLALFLVCMIGLLQVQANNLVMCTNTPCKDSSTCKYKGEQCVQGQYSARSGRSLLCCNVTIVPPPPPPDYRQSKPCSDRISFGRSTPSKDEDRKIKCEDKTKFKPDCYWRSVYLGTKGCVDTPPPKKF